MYFVSTEYFNEFSNFMEGVVGHMNLWWWELTTFGGGSAKMWLKLGMTPIFLLNLIAWAQWAIRYLEHKGCIANISQNSYS